MRRKPGIAAARTLWLSLSLLGLLLTLAFASATASADTVHTYLSQFNGSMAPQGSISPSGLAANQGTGAVYVTSADHENVDVFDPSGVYQSQLTQADGVTPYKFGNAYTITVNQATGAVYVADPSKSVVEVFNAAGVYQFQVGEGVLPYGDNEVNSVAVDDTTGEIYVGAGPVVYVFDSSGVLLSRWTGANTPNLSFIGILNVAVDQSSHDVYVSEDTGNSSVYKLSSSGRYLSQLTDADGQTPYNFGERGARQLTVGPEGHVYVFVHNENFSPAKSEIVEFAAAGGAVGAISGTPAGAFADPEGLAVGRGGDLYVGEVTAAPPVVDVFGPDLVLPDVSTEAGSATSETSVSLHGTIDPDETEVTSCQFEYGYEAGVYSAGSVPCDPAPPYSGQSPIDVTASLSGLEPRTVYHFRLSAANANGAHDGNDNVVFTSSAPLVEAEYSSAVGSTVATVGARLDAAGLPTTYRVEYGPSSVYGSSTPEASIGAGDSYAGALIQLSGLLPNTTYHFRFVATNVLGSTEGGDMTFTTALSTVSSSSALPDGRTYELVSPVDNANGDVYISYERNHTSENAYNYTELPYQAAANGNAVAYVAEAPSSGGNGNVLGGGGNEFLAVRSANGWNAVDIEPASKASGYQAFSPNLTIAILGTNEEGLAYGAPPGYQDLYARVTSNGSYQALSTIKPPHCPSGFGAVEVPIYTLYAVPQPAFAGGNSGTSEVGEFSHLLFEANAALTTPAQTNPPSCEQNDLYESIDGQLSLVNVLPDGTATATATLGAKAPDFSHVISADGSRVFWTDLEEGADMGHIFMREDEERTVPVSLGSATYWTASSDGRYALYTEGEELWRFDSQAHAQEAIAGPGASVQGVIGASEDGSYVYFVADGVLAGNENANKEVAREGEANLYLWHQGVTTFLALSPASSDWQPNLANRTAEVTPDGRHLVFMSSARLTGYDNESPGRAAASEEVFSYDAQSGQVDCASCDPSGAPPQTLAAAPDKSFEEPILPISHSNTYVPRWISDDGSRVFFDTPQPLVANDTNKINDVYEWERDGAGSCEQSEGCVYLISSGTSKTASEFIDADATGANVFFTTRDRLVPQDANEDMDLYDARVDGGFARPTPPQCTGTGCQGVPATTPVFATPASATFTGVGNFPPPKPTIKPRIRPLTRAQKLVRALKTCRAKVNRHRRAVCEARAKKRYGPISKSSESAKAKRHTQRANANRGAKR